MILIMKDSFEEIFQMIKLLLSCDPDEFPPRAFSVYRGIVNKSPPPLNKRTEPLSGDF